MPLTLSETTSTSKYFMVSCDVPDNDKLVKFVEPLNEVLGLEEQLLYILITDDVKHIFDYSDDKEIDYESSDLYTVMKTLSNMLIDGCVVGLIDYPQMVYSIAYPLFVYDYAGINADKSPIKYVDGSKIYNIVIDEHNFNNETTRKCIDTVHKLLRECRIFSDDVLREYLRCVELVMKDIRKKYLGNEEEEE